MGVSHSDECAEHVLAIIPNALFSEVSCGQCCIILSASIHKMEQEYITKILCPKIVLCSASKIEM